MKGNKVLSNVFVGIGGGISSKRVMLFLSFSMMVAMASLSIFYDKKIEQFIFDGFLYIVIGGLFSVASERFSSSYRKVSPDEYYQEAPMDEQNNRRS